MNKNEYIEAIKDLRYNHIDTLPKNRLSPEDKDINYHKYKCRGNYMAGVRAYIHKLISNNMINDPEAVKKGNEFITYIADRDWERLTTKEEIDMVNNTLDTIIKDLEKNLNF